MVGGSHQCRVERGPRRRAFSAMELVLTLPIFVFLLLGIFEFAILFHARSTVIEASRVGARLASLQGARTDQVEQQVREVLPVPLHQDMTVDYVGGVKSGDTVMVGIRVPMSAAAPDLLWPVGFSLNGRSLYAETCMVKE